MKITIDDPSGLPEGLKALAETDGDATTLDLSKLMPAEDLTGLKTALVKERENAAAWKKYGTPDEIAARIADLEAKAAKGGKGGEDAQAKLDALTKDYDAKLKDRDEAIDKMRRAHSAESLKAELAKAGVVPEGLDLLASFAANRIAYNDDGTPKVMTTDGKPMIGSGADHGATLSDLAKEIAGSIPHLVADKGKGGSGKLPGSNGGKPAKSFSELTSQELVTLRRENPQEYDRLKAQRPG